MRQNSYFSEEYLVSNNSTHYPLSDAEAEAAVLRPPDAKSQLTGKAPDAGEDWGQEEKGVTGWDSWMASPTPWTWVWASSGRWWRTGKPGMPQSMGSQRGEDDWATEKQQQQAIIILGEKNEIHQQVLWALNFQLAFVWKQSRSQIAGPAGLFSTPAQGRQRPEYGLERPTPCSCIMVSHMDLLFRMSGRPHLSRN